MGKTYLFVSAQYLPTVGGVERYTWNLARRLVAAGNRALVVTTALPGLPAREADPDGIEIFRLPAWRLMGGRFPVAKPGREFAAQAARLWQEPIDCAVVNTYFYPLCLYMARQCRRRGLPAVAVNHGTAWLMTGAAPLRWAGMAYEQLSARYMNRQCPRFYGVSQAACQWVEQFGVRPQGVLTNAVDPAELRAAAESAGVDWRQRLGLAPDTPVIAFAGRILEEKGVPPLAAAMAEVRRTHPRAVLLLAGDGPLRAGLEQQALPGVYFLGTQPYAATLALLAQAQVFCLPTRSEGFAGAVLEAAALRCPIITTRTGGSPQLLPTPADGILLDTMDRAEIASACTRALSDPAWRAEAAARTYQRLCENYTWEQAVKALVRVFETGEPAPRP